MKLAVVFLVASLLLGLPQPASAQYDHPPAAAALLTAVSDSIDNNLDRPRLARLILDYCTDVLRALPRNSPREDTWVNEEAQSGNWDRMKRAIESVEMARQIVVNSFTACAAHSSSLTKMTSPRPSTEAVLWARLARAFLNERRETYERLALVKYETNAWIDPYHLMVLPSAVTDVSLTAVIESLGQKR